MDYKSSCPLGRSLLHSVVCCIDINISTQSGHNKTSCRHPFAIFPTVDQYNTLDGHHDRA